MKYYQGIILNVNFVRLPVPYSKRFLQTEENEPVGQAPFVPREPSSLSQRVSAP